MVLPLNATPRTRHPLGVWYCDYRQARGLIRLAAKYAPALAESNLTGFRLTSRSKRILIHFVWCIWNILRWL